MTVTANAVAVFQFKGTSNKVERRIASQKRRYDNDK